MEEIKKNRMLVYKEHFHILIFISWSLVIIRAKIHKIPEGEIFREDARRYAACINRKAPAEC